MRIKTLITISLLLTCSFSDAQVKAIYHTADLLNRISGKDTSYVVNFWAVWCKPCIEELPSFDSLQKLNTHVPVKVLLVSVDFKENKGKVNTFLKKKNITAECVLLDEINGNAYIDKISPQWSGAIPATLFRKGAKTIFLEKKTKLVELQENLKKLQSL